MGEASAGQNAPVASRQRRRTALLVQDERLVQNSLQVLRLMLAAFGGPGGA
jgi:hypothetical protein